MDAVLDVQNITKDFGDGKGIFDVSLSIQPGEIVGFVGPNGAGKSTTINAVTGLIKPQQGSVALFGRQVDQVSIHSLFPKVGVMYSESTIEEGKTARQIFERTQALLGKNYDKSWTGMSRIFGLDTNKKVKKLSLGNKKKVAAVRTLMHEPDLIIMDEPTSGLDPIMRESLMELIHHAADNGAAVLLSSHDLGEVQQVSTRIIMIKSGKIIVDDSTPNILHKSLRLFRLINPPKELADKLTALPGVQSPHKQGKDLLFHTKDYEAVVKQLNSAKFYNFFLEQPSLEDAFKEMYE